MLNKNGELTIECNKCNKQFKEEVPVYIDALKDKDLKDKYLNYELYMFTCPHCGQKQFVEYPVLYVNEKRKFASLFHNNLSELIDFYEDGNYFDGNRKYDDILKIGSLNAFEAIGKIIALENGYNYKIVEVYRYVVKNDFIQMNPDATDLHVDLVYNEKNQVSWIVYFIQDEEQKAFFVDFSKQDYQELYNLYKDKLDGTNDFLFNEVVAKRVMMDDDELREMFKNATIMCYEVASGEGLWQLSAPPYNDLKYDEGENVVIREEYGRFSQVSITKKYQFTMYEAPIPINNGDADSIIYSMSDDRLVESFDKSVVIKNPSFIKALSDGGFGKLDYDASLFPYELAMKTRVLMLEEFVGENKEISRLHSVFIHLNSGYIKTAMAFVDEKSVNEYLNTCEEPHNIQDIEQYIFNLDDVLVNSIISLKMNDGILIMDSKNNYMINNQFIYKYYLLERLYYMGNKIYEIIENFNEAEQLYVGKETCKKLLAMKNKDELFDLLRECNVEHKLDEFFKECVRQVVKVIKNNYANYK